MRLLLDTAVLILAVESPERLSRQASTALRNGDNILELSAVSVAEIAIKANLGKLKLTSDHTRQALEDLDIRILSFGAEHAFALFGLPFHHFDPFDRQIIAQAMAEDIPVVSSDRMFRQYKGLNVVW